MKKVLIIILLIGLYAQVQAGKKKRHPKPGCQELSACITSTPLNIFHLNKLFDQEEQLVASVEELQDTILKQVQEAESRTTTQGLFIPSVQMVRALLQQNKITNAQRAFMVRVATNHLEETDKTLASTLQCVQAIDVESVNNCNSVEESIAQLQAFSQQLHKHQRTLTNAFNRKVTIQQALAKHFEGIYTSPLAQYRQTMEEITQRRTQFETAFNQTHARLIKARLTNDEIGLSATEKALVLIIEVKESFDQKSLLVAGLLNSENSANTSESNNDLILEELTALSSYMNNMQRALKRYNKLLDTFLEPVSHHITENDLD